jgi:8-oxo-dGTP diphosphatase
MNQRPGVGVGVFVLRGGKIVMLRRKGAHGAGNWSCPGGHLEFGETIFAAALREAREETGLEVNNPRFMAVTNDIFEEGRHYITIFVATDYVAGEPKVIEDEFTTEIGWFDIDDMPQPLFLPTQNLLAGRCYPQDWRERLKI